LFIHTFNSEDVSLEKVGSFYEITRQEAASEYAEALADYVRAALIKDGDKRTGVSSRLHHYHDIQNRALGILQSFDRPVANLLCALMRFGLNDFSRWQEKTGVAKLDEANATLGPLAFPGQEQLRVAEAEESKTNVVRFVFPVDIGTARSRSSPNRHPHFPAGVRQRRSYSMRLPIARPSTISTVPRSVHFGPQLLCD
jgi:hypothetical protein